MELNFYGILHPFRFVNDLRDINEGVVYKIGGTFNFILTDTDQVLINTVEAFDINTGAAITVNQIGYSWDIDGKNRKSLRCTISVAEGTRFRIKVNTFISETFETVPIWVDGIIERVEFSKRCGHVIKTRNDCSNDYHDWSVDSVPGIYLYLYDVVDLINDFEDEQITVFTSAGKKVQTVKNSDIQKFEFVGPLGYKNLLQACTRHSIVSTDYYLLKNFKYEVEPLPNGLYGKFTVSFENSVDLNNSDCCEAINIDDIAAPDYDGGATGCGTFAIDIVNTNNVLSVTLTDPPTGTATYKWFKNGVQIATTSTITITGGATYKVEVKIGTCTKTATYFIDDICSLFSLNLTVSGDEIDGVVSNVPSGATVSYDIIFNGASVGTSLPHTALATGNYFVRVTAGNCTKTQGVYVDINVVETFNLSINQNGSVLEAVTDATSPTYLWELENADGRTTIGSAATQTIQGRGIYFLTVNGKTVYKYIAPISEATVCVLNKASGTEFTVYEIDLLSIDNPSIDLEVYVNGVRQMYSSSTPSSGQYSINTNGKLTTFAAIPLNNATIIIKYK